MLLLGAMSENSPPCSQAELAARIRAELAELSGLLDGDFIVIGGWAVHAYKPFQLTFDGDAMVSLEAAGVLRDFYEITPNPRMRKAQFVSRAGCDVDLYIERQHGLRVPFDRAQAASRVVEGLRVACPEHLLALKCDAALARRGSAKGEKDTCDLVALLSLDASHYTLPGELVFVSPEGWELLAAVASDVAASERFCGGNSKEAARLRRDLAAALTRLRAAAGHAQPV